MMDDDDGFYLKGKEAIYMGARISQHPCLSVMPSFACESTAERASIKVLAYYFIWLVGEKLDRRKYGSAK